MVLGVLGVVVLALVLEAEVGSAQLATPTVAATLSGDVQGFVKFTDDHTGGTRLSQSARGSRRGPQPFVAPLRARQCAPAVVPVAVLRAVKRHCVEQVRGLTSRCIYATRIARVHRPKATSGMSTRGRLRLCRVPAVALRATRPLWALIMILPARPKRVLTTAAIQLCPRTAIGETCLASWAW